MSTYQEMIQILFYFLEYYATEVTWLYYVPFFVYKKIFS